MAISYRDAIREALADSLDADDSVFLLGEDIARGGVFNVTAGLAERYGTERIIDTPISELAFTGAAFGAALKGLRPVVEIMFGDFMGLVLDTVVNQAAKYWYLSNEQASVPIVIRTAVGAGGRLGACHSQTPTAWVFGEPGVKVVAPATPGDAKWLTRQAVVDDNPVIIFEHKMLYAEKGDIPDSPPDGIGTAAIRRSGGDVTIVAALAAVGASLRAAEDLASAGIDAEVIDLRSLRPLDGDTIASSTARTGHLLVVEEGPPVGGYAAEVVAQAVERVGPIAARRLTMPDLPIPFSGILEDSALPNAPAIVRAAEQLLGEGKRRDE